MKINRNAERQTEQKVFNTLKGKLNEFYVFRADYYEIIDEERKIRAEKKKCQ